MDSIIKSIRMPSYELKINKLISIKGRQIQKGLSVQISTHSGNPFDAQQQINDAFKRIHGLDLLSEGYANAAFLDYKQL